MAANPRTTKQATIDGTPVETDYDDPIACTDGSALSPESALKQVLWKADAEEYGVERVCRWAARARRRALGGDDE
jgi:hypothetical protein